MQGIKADLAIKDQLPTSSLKSQDISAKVKLQPVFLLLNNENRFKQTTHHPLGRK